MPADSPASENRPSRPFWSQVLRALREAGGVTQDGWSAELGIGRTTLQRWETGQATPDSDAEEAIIEVCQRRGLFRRYESGPMRGITLTPEILRNALSEGRLGSGRGGFAPAAEVEAEVHTPDATAAPALDPVPATEPSVPRRLGKSPAVAAAVVFVVVLVAVGAVAYALTRDDGSGATAAQRVSIATLYAERPGGFISYTSEEDGRPALLVVNFDGSDVAVVLDDPLFDSDARWSPDGRQLLFTSRVGNNRDIYITTLGQGSPVRLADHPSDDLEPTWSPDGSLIAFTSGREGSKAIYTMTPTGIVRDKLTSDPSDNFHPAWSPDGTKIAFASTRDGNREIYLMDADGSNVTRVTDHPGDDDQPAWSPDGQQIAFQSRRDGNREIYAINVDGSGLRRITNDPADDRQPAWSPDGGHLAFVSTRDGHRELYVVRSDGTGLRRLTESPANKDQPTWVETTPQ